MTSGAGSGSNFASAAPLALDAELISDLDASLVLDLTAASSECHL